MATAEYQENIVSLIPALRLLMNLGYSYLSPSEGQELRGGRLSQAVLDRVLRQQLSKINSFTFKGQSHKFNESNISKAVQEMSTIPFDSLVTTNEQVYDLLTLGKSFEQTIQGYTRSFTLKYIDFANPTNNVFHVSDEFVVERRHSHQTRRPDIVLFVNGMPLSVVECKRPDKPEAVLEGVSQHLRNQLSDEIPHLFVYSQLLLSVSQNAALYGTTGTPRRFWGIWKEDYGSQEVNHLHALVNRSLPDDQLEKVFAGRDDWQKREMESQWLQGPRVVSSQDMVIYSLLRPERLLEITERFVVFDNSVKKVPRYQQYFAVKRTMERVARGSADRPRKGGVIWHTTGSGKSITMVLLAKALSLCPDIPNPKVILVTDRVDLDDQIWKTFLACGKQVDRARTGEHLFRLIEENRATIITTIIDKFDSGLQKRGFRIDDRNVFVLVDESHRSQYGETHAAMRRVFPSACYIGFTGTPLLRKEKSTARRFGGFIHTYSMNQAVADGAVARLIYEGRMSELRGDKEQIDRWFNRITEDLTENQKADLKRKFRREEEINRSGERLCEIAYDIAKHFEWTFRGTGLKGQFAVSSRDDAVKYLRIFNELTDLSVAVVMSPPDTRVDHDDIDESSIPEVQAFWKAMMAQHGTPDKYQDNIIRAFKRSDEPEVLIVIDKLLTGFDAPRNTVLYVDKRLKDHNVLQAIARVNRLHDGKEHGLIVDYRGIFGELNEAIEIYRELGNRGYDLEDVEGTITNVREEIAGLRQRHADVWQVFSGVANTSDTEAMQLRLEPEDRRHRFFETLRAYTNTLRLALSNAWFHETTSDKEVARYKKDLKMFQSLRVAVMQRFGESVDYSSYEAQIRNMVNKYIGADEVREIVPPVDLFSLEFLEKELEGIEGDAAKADTIVSRMKKTITERMEEDPILYRQLSDLIAEAIAEHRAKRLSDAEYLKAVRDTLSKMQSFGTPDLPDEIKGHDEAVAHYRIVLEEVSRISSAQSAPSYGSALARMAGKAGIEIESIVSRLSKVDWHRDPDTQHAMINEIEDYLFSLRDQSDIPLDTNAIDRIIEQSLRVAKSRDLHDRIRDN